MAVAVQKLSQWSFKNNFFPSLSFPSLVSLFLRQLFLIRTFFLYIFYLHFIYLDLAFETRIEQAREESCGVTTVTVDDITNPFER